MSANATTRTLLLLALLLFPAALVRAQEDDWLKIKAEYDKLFTPPPIKGFFNDLDKELNYSRRAPFTGAARTEIDQRRTKERLKREQVFVEREERATVIELVVKHGGDHAARVLMEIYEKQLENIEAAQENVDRIATALTIDINPGVDPGGLYWERWVNKSERPDARSVLAWERKIRDLALEGCAKLLTPEIRAWLVRNAEDHDSPEVREQMIGVLAGSGDPADAAALGKVLESAREPWIRILILDAFAAKKMPGAEAFVTAALADEDWPVRSAAIDAVRALGVVGTEARTALERIVNEDDGRLRYEAMAAIPDQPPPARPTRFCGQTTASRRIAFVFPGGRWTREPTRRRKLANDGSLSPEPPVDTAVRIAAWELEEALNTLPEDARFTVVVAAGGTQLWSKKLKKVSKSTVRSATTFLLSRAPKGGGSLSDAIEAALEIGAKGKSDDVALAEPGDVDTIFVLWGRTKGYERITRLRRVDLIWAKLPSN